ncbi:hypothetical protein SteCoe_991 [Stentor coeruleus]|uniref:Tyrosine-protein kinase ephrin type A/B receptor-like domain-containing protein n=1 Tax=Stentor coeruleus TaxID=5963 RepID=A0A1R2D2T5_9CILI|nr:hypothetical protein SteCoe_991 [Stentor coeruleus]
MLVRIVFLSVLCESVKINLTPNLGPSPPLITHSSAVYDEMTSNLITIGGFNTESEQLTREIFTFNLLNNTWGEIIPESEYIPEPFQDHYLHLTKSRVILVLFPVSDKGLLSDIFAFDLKTLKWEKKTLTGEPISSRRHSSICSFSHNGTDYFAIYGGFEKSEYDENLYLVDSDQFISYKLPNNGLDSPGIKDSASFIYHEGKLILYGSSNIFDKFSSEENLYIYDMETLAWNKTITKGNINKVFFHKAVIQKKSMFIYFGHDDNGPTNILKRLDLDTYTWEYIGKIDERYFLGFIACEVENILYFLHAYTNNTIYEPILSIDIATNPTMIFEVAPRFEWPRKRQGHCMITMNNKLVIIGGLAEDDLTYLDDVWQLDTETVIWTKLVISGDSFKGRAYMSCYIFDGMIFLSGGKNNNDIFDDTLFLNLKSFTWTKINPLSSINFKTYSSCVVSGNFIYTAFGVSINGYLDTIFLYNFTSNSLKVSYHELGPKIKLANHVCWISNSIDKDEIFIANGETSNGNPSRYLYKVTIFANDTDKYNVKIVAESDELAKTMTALVKNDDFAFLIFGVMRNKFVSDDITCVNLKTFQINSIDTGIYAYGHAASHLRDKIYVFGSGGFYGRSKKRSASSKLYSVINTNDDIFEFGCGPGSDGPICKPCSQGFYYDSKECYQCPPGTYSHEQGAISRFACTRCPKGSYSDTFGSRYCRECPISANCTIGSSSLNSSFTLFSDNIKYTQPSAYTQNSDFINKVNNISLFVLAGISFLLIMLLIFNKFMRNNMKKIDLFSGSHNTLENNPIIIRKTLLGGYFSCVFFFTAFSIILNQTLSYFNNNVLENKTLIPLVIENRPIYSESFYIRTELSVFGGSCELSQFGGEMKILLDETNIDFSYKNYKAWQIFGENKKCVVEIFYEKFAIHYESSIVLKIHDFLAYAGMINITIETNSSIPNGNSIIEQTLVPDNDNEVFNGNSYNEFFIKVTPSLFESESSSWPSLSKGFHLSQSQVPTKGSSVDEKALSVVGGVHIKINLSQSENLLYTKRTLKNSFFVVISALTGAVFGVMGSFGSIMGFVEGKLDYVVNKIAKMKKLREIISIRKNIRLLFDDIQTESFNEKNDICSTSYDSGTLTKYSKIVPVSTFIDNLD